MAATNFGLLLDHQKTVWERDTWKAQRNSNFFQRFVGGNGAMIHRIDELTKDERGTRAVITLVADLEGDGVVGDNELEGNEEGIRAYDKVINIDQMRHANKSKGRMAEQATVVRFREQSRDVLGHWLGDRLTQLMFLTLAGLAYSIKPDGTTRVGSQFSQLSFAGDINPPTSGRHFRWDATTGLSPAGTGDIIAADTPTYEMLGAMKAQAQTSLMRPIRGQGDLVGLEHYIVFMTPFGMQKLKEDDKFHAALKDAMPRTPNNPLFKGANVYWIDGMAIYVHNHVPHATTWGAGAVHGQTVLMCGAQALGYADIDVPKWAEKTFDYDAKPGIAISKICGLLKPQFHSQVTGQVEDFGVIRVDTAV